MAGPPGRSLKTSLYYMHSTQLDSFSVPYSHTPPVRRALVIVPPIAALPYLSELVIYDNGSSYVSAQAGLAKEDGIMASCNGPAQAALIDSPPQCHLSQ